LRTSLPTMPVAPVIRIIDPPVDIAECGFRVA
jgi:hypothetical protein